MGRFRFHLPSVFFASFLLLSAANASSLDVEGFDLTGGVLLLLNADAESAPSPVENTLGLNLPLSFTRHFGAHLGMDFYAIRYQIREDGIYPADAEFADYTTTGTIALRLPLLFNFGLSSNINAGFGTGPLFLLRFPLKTWGSVDEEALMEHLYREGSFIYPEFLMHMNWKFSRTQALTLSGRFQYPLSRFLGETGNNIWYDRIMIQLQIGLRFLSR